MSRSSSKKQTYHHGDLRNALIRAGVALLAAEGVQGLSMRKLARQAGVSHNAPYMHFADKEALLAAIATEGFHILGAAVETAVSEVENDWPQQLQAASQAYVQFALKHPYHLQVMFRLSEHAKEPALLAAARAAMAQLDALILSGQAAGFVRPGNSDRQTACVWSLLHGMATILIANKMPPMAMGGDTAAELTHHFVEMLMAGLGTPAVN